MKRFRNFGLPALVAGVLLWAAACGGNKPTVSPADADKLLLERGNTALKERKWVTGRQYFSELLESYP